MIDPPPFPNDGEDTGARSGHGSTTNKPAWVKVVGFIVIILFVLFLVIQHLAGGGMSGLHQ